MTRNLSNQKKFVVFVDDNYHYMDESERYQKGEYATFDEARSVCEKIVDDFLTEAWKLNLGVSAADLYNHFVQYGEDPFIVGGEQVFSAWDYAKLRCNQLCAQTDHSCG